MAILSRRARVVLGGVHATFRSRAGAPGRERFYRWKRLRLVGGQGSQCADVLEPSGRLLLVQSRRVRIVLSDAQVMVARRLQDRAAARERVDHGTVNVRFEDRRRDRRVLLVVMSIAMVALPLLLVATSGVGVPMVFVSILPGAALVGAVIYSGRPAVPEVETAELRPDGFSFRRFDGSRGSAGIPEIRRVRCVGGVRIELTDERRIDMGSSAEVRHWLKALEARHVKVSWPATYSPARLGVAVLVMSQIGAVVAVMGQLGGWLLFPWSPLRVYLTFAAMPVACVISFAIIGIVLSPRQVRKWWRRWRASRGARTPYDRSAWA